MRLGKSINTNSGEIFWPLDPRDHEIKAVDIAHSLSLLCRANGHYRHFYSVAQHSLHCAEEARVRGLSLRVELACLLHDGSEAYIADLTRPVKAVLDQYRDIEARLQAQIYRVFGLDELNDDERAQVQAIDDAMLNYEMTHLLDNPGLNDLTLSQGYDLSFRMMDEVKEAFLARLAQLQAEMAARQADALAG